MNKGKYNFLQKVMIINSNFLGIYKVPSVLCCPCERPELVVLKDSNVIGYLK